MSDRVEVKYTEVGLNAYIVHSLKWWQIALNLFYPFFKKFTTLDNLEVSDLVIVDENGYSIKKKSLTFTPELGTFEIEVEGITSGSVSVSSNIAKEYYSTIEKLSNE